MILRLLRLTADLSDEPRRYHTNLFIYDKNLSPATMQEVYSDNYLYIYIILLLINYFFICSLDEF